METQSLKKQVRRLLWFFIAALVLSGVTAFPLRWEITILQRLFGPGTFVESLWPAMAEWISLVHLGITETYRRYPFMAYGTDWLAFAHIVIAIAFWGPIKDPVKNIWVVECGMIACVLVIPLAMIWGPIRGIPFFWRLIDSSFGVVGIIPLWAAHNDIRRIAELEQATHGHPGALGDEAVKVG
jgi:hypothetical protein